MSEKQFDCIIIGGGLAGGLIALALHRARPEFRIALIEAGKTLGGNHRWSWFGSDLDDDGHALLATFRQSEWVDGYRVIFPKYRRMLDTPYHSMTSHDFHEGLMRELPDGAVMLGESATQIDARGVELGDNSRLEARAVIDCRNFEPSPHLKGGWQLFMGRHMRFEYPHKLTHPIIMDANVEQLAPYGDDGGKAGAYRFVYTLPLGAHDVFIEDTYYADEKQIDRSALSARIDQYAQKRRWLDGAIIGHEVGALPVLTGGDFTAYQRSIQIPGVTIAGARGGFVHPLTSYTIAMAVENALTIANYADLSGEQLAAMMHARARRHWKRTRFYRLLARMMFLAAEPGKRVTIFQRFYRLRQRLIERFYAARSSNFDKFRLLAGKPPVSVFRAIPALFNSGPPLRSEAPPEN